MDYAISFHFRVPAISLALVCQFTFGCDVPAEMEDPSEALNGPDAIKQPSSWSTSEQPCASGLDLEAMRAPFQLTPVNGPNLADAMAWTSLGPVPQASCSSTDPGVPLPLGEDVEGPEDLTTPIDTDPAVLDGHRPVIIDGWAGAAWLATQPAPAHPGVWAMPPGDPPPQLAHRLGGAEAFTAAPNAGEPRSVIGNDNRAYNPNTTTSPWRKAVGLRPKIGVSSNGINQYSTNSDCSGAFVGPRHVLTAAHCVWRNGGLKNVRVVPGQNGSGTALADIPFGTYWVKYYSVPQGWINDPSTDNVRYDYAVLALGEEPHVGWLGFGTASYSDLKNVLHQVASYPIEIDELSHYVPCANSPVQGLCGGYQYTQSAQIEHVYSATLKSVHDATQGQSGTPVWKFSNQTVHAVLTKGAGSWTLLTRIRTGVFDFICKAIHDNPTMDNHACY